MGIPSQSQQVNNLIVQWQHAAGDSHPFGLTSDQLVELAELAVRKRSEPRMWGPGDHIPDDVMSVLSAGDSVWRRKCDEDGADTGRWIMIEGLSENRLLDDFGPVREDGWSVVREPSSSAEGIWRDGPSAGEGGAGDRIDLFALASMLTVLNNAANTLYYIADKKGTPINQDEYNRCLAVANSCRRVANALQGSARD